MSKHKHIYLATTESGNPVGLATTMDAIKRKTRGRFGAVIIWRYSNPEICERLGEPKPKASLYKDRSKGFTDHGS